MEIKETELVKNRDYEYLTSLDRSLTLNSIKVIERKTFKGNDKEYFRFCDGLRTMSVPKTADYLEMVFMKDPRVAGEIFSRLAKEDSLFVNRNASHDQIFIRRSNGMFADGNWTVFML